MDFDIIGDTHGHADHLERVLTRMGYTPSGPGFRPPSGRQAFFLGDFIDRGQQQQRTLMIVRSMIDDGNAQAIAGNHEFNAVCFATMAEDGLPIRRHTAQNIKSHAAFLDEFNPQANPALYDDAIAFFKTLPVYRDMPDFTAIHACLHPPSLAAVAPFLGEGNILTDAGYREYGATPRGDFYRGIETLIKSPEYPLPEGIMYTDINGIDRTRTRIKWWGQYDQPHLKMMDAVEQLTDEHKRIIDADPFWDAFSTASLAKPLFIGHFQLDRTPGPLEDGDGRVVCLDFRRRVTAYRFSAGEPVRAENFVYSA